MSEASKKTENQLKYAPMVVTYTYKQFDEQ